MEQYIPKAALVAEIEKCYEEYLKRAKIYVYDANYWIGKADAYHSMLEIIDILEVKDPYEQCVQYDSIKAGIQAHAETYSFNTESLLFNQLTKEQQVLWRKEIEQACISGGDAGVGLARDIRYKENLEVKEVDFEMELKEFLRQYYNYDYPKQYQDGTGSNIMPHIVETAKYFFNLGLKARKGK